MHLLCVRCVCHSPGEEATMSGNGPFGFDPEDFDRVIRDAGDGRRDALSKFLTRSG